MPRHACHNPYIDACTCSCLQIRWDMVTEAVPAFLTIAVMPLTYSIAYGESQLDQHLTERHLL